MSNMHSTTSIEICEYVNRIKKGTAYENKVGRIIELALSVLLNDDLKIETEDDFKKLVDRGTEKDIMLESFADEICRKIMANSDSLPSISETRYEEFYALLDEMDQGSIFRYYTIDSFIGMIHAVFEVAFMKGTLPQKRDIYTRQLKAYSRIFNQSPYPHTKLFMSFLGRQFYDIADDEIFNQIGKKDKMFSFHLLSVNFPSYPYRFPTLGDARTWRWYKNCRKETIKAHKEYFGDLIPWKRLRRLTKKRWSGPRLDPDIYADLESTDHHRSYKEGYHYEQINDIFIFRQLLRLIVFEHLEFTPIDYQIFREGYWCHGEVSHKYGLDPLVSKMSSIEAANNYYEQGGVNAYLSLATQEELSEIILNIKDVISWRENSMLLGMCYNSFEDNFVAERDPRSGKIRLLLFPFIAGPMPWSDFCRNIEGPIQLGVDTFRIFDGQHSHTLTFRADELLNELKPLINRTVLQRVGFIEAINTIGITFYYLRHLFSK